MDVTFRNPSIADLDLLVHFMREFYQVDQHPFDEQAARSSLRKILNDDSLGKVWLIEMDGSTIGYVVLTLGFSLEFRGRDAFIDEFYIREEHQGKGIGKKSLEFVESVCRSLDVQALHLEVKHDNSNAQAVYRKFGFEDRDHYLMTKRIAG